MGKEPQIEEVLLELKELGIKHNLFKETTLGEIKHSCVPKSDLLVIDYDQTAEQLFFEHLKSVLNKPKSCDALRFNKTSYDFIEMKSLKDLFSNRFKENKESFLDKDFTSKFTNSVFSFFALLQVARFKLTNKKKELLQNACGWYFVLVDTEFNYNNGECENNEEFHAIMNFLSLGYKDNVHSNALPSNQEMSDFLDEFSATLETQFDKCPSFLPNIQTKLITPNGLNAHYGLL